MSSPQDRLEAFLDGERPDDVAIYIHDEQIGDMQALTEVAVRVETGVVLVVDGERGQRAFEQLSGVAAMEFAGAAMDTDGQLAHDLTGGRCPQPGASHSVGLLLAFAEEQHPEMDGIHGEGAVIHAYAACRCGERYSDRWLADDEPADATG